MLRISSFWTRISPNISLSRPVMALKPRARSRNSPLRRVETAMSKSPPATRFEASMTSRRGPVTDRVRKEGQDEREEGDRRRRSGRACRAGRRAGLRSRFMNTLSRRAPTMRPPSRRGMLIYIMSALSVELGRMDICVSPLEGGLDLGSEEMVLHVPGFFFRVGQDCPVGVDDGDPGRGVPADGCHEGLEIPGGGPGDVREHLAFEEPGHVLQAGGPLFDVMLPHEGRREDHHRRGQQDDDGRIPGKEP